jgi:predicted GNAT family acetyltransferase
MPDAPAGLKKCSLHDRREIQRKLGAYLSEYGDIPPEEVASAIASPEQWTLWCDQYDQIAAAMRVDQSDWYLCTLKNAAVRPDQRGKRLGSRLYQATTRRAMHAPSCLVLAADVTYDNAPSIRALERSGFRKVNRFCWGRGEKPADILHYVRMPSKDDRC